MNRNFAVATADVIGRENVVEVAPRPGEVDERHGPGLRLGPRRLDYEVVDVADIGKKSRCAPVEHRAGDDVHAVVDPDVTQDRKSTRLNSSHSQISYAVFCLKKKK